MNVDRARFLLLTLSISACHGEAARPLADAKPAATTVTVETAKAPSPPDSGASTDPCVLLAAANDAVLAHPSGTCAPPQADDDDPHAKDVAATEPDVRADLLAQGAKTPFFHACHRGKGTWAVALESAKLDSPTGESGVSCGWSVTYKWLFQADAKEPITKGVASDPADYDKFADETADEDEGQVFDFDGDGRDELIVGSSEWQNGGGGRNSVRVLTSSGKSIDAYPIDASPSSSIDADGDGRPDFLYTSTFSTEHCGLVPTNAEGPRLLLHSLPDGTFSGTDEVARRWAATECPRPAPGTSAERVDCATDGACLRIWGQSKAAVARAMKASASCASECQAAEMTKEVSAWKPPFATLDKQTPQPFPKAKTE